MRAQNPVLILYFNIFSCFLYASFGYNPKDNFLIDFGSSTNTSVGDRIFVSDKFFTNSQNSSVNISTNSEPETLYDSTLFKSARIFNGKSEYSFSIQEPGRHIIRLNFYPFVSGNWNLSMAKFSVSAQNFTLIKQFKPKNGVPEVREYSLNVTSNRLVLSFIPFVNSFAFVNALEVFSIPKNVIPFSISNHNHSKKLWNSALETVERVNMGNQTVLPLNDSLWRLWSSDSQYLTHMNIGTFKSNVSAVKFTDRGPDENVAPASVYGTATVLMDDTNTNGFNANVTWLFDVDPGFEYMVRFHFCNILGIARFYFNVYIGSSLVAGYFDINNQTKVSGVPYYMDVITKVKSSRMLNVSIGPPNTFDQPSAILNGLEIMKISNSKESLDVLDVVGPSSKSSKMRVILIVGMGVGLLFLIVCALMFFMLHRRKRLARMKADNQYAMNGGDAESKFSVGTTIFSTSKFGYRFPFVAIQEATDNFSESLILGVGGFGKVYKGVLRDETKVAVKRGTSQSQGIAEFKTEIEMLSQFRHRHLVSLIGYCDEKNELIIVYEYMENGTLKDHLYGSKNPGLYWRQRLEICIGAAKGLHYLHTGSTKAIIHRDVKSANILLDETFMAKVADFGLSKTGPDLDKTHVSTAVKGSFGYLDPEYLIRQQLTEKSDVYSFGVVMFEVLCGRPVIDPSLPRDKVNLIDWALKCYRAGQLEEILDPALDGQVKPDSLLKFVEIAEKCLAECGLYRPSMGDVLWNLESALQLQLQGNEDQSNQNGKQTTPLINRATSFETSVSGSMADIAGVSMSKVFAQMVKEEMR